MATLPRIITVDPTWTLPRIVRAVLDLADLSAILVNVPGGNAALEELSRGGCQLLLTVVELDDNMKGVELALRTRQLQPGAAVVILADLDDMEMDDETQAESPFVFMRRPVDPQKFTRVVGAALAGEDIFDAFRGSDQQQSTGPDLGPVPGLDVKAAHALINRLMSDLNAQGIILATRTGEVLLEGGAVRSLNREELTNALLPMVATHHKMSHLVGGQAATVQFFDGETFDVFVLSVGLHHFLCVVFDGQNGARQFGAVNRFGRRTAEDLIALLGANAFIVRQAVAEEPPAARKPRKRPTQEVEAAPVLLEKAVGLEDSRPKAKEPEAARLEPITNLDPSILDQLDALNTNDADALFDMDVLADLAKEKPSSGRDSIGYDQARELGILP